MSTNVPQTSALPAVNKNTSPEPAPPTRPEEVDDRREVERINIVTRDGVPQYISVDHIMKYPESAWCQFVTTYRTSTILTEMDLETVNIFIEYLKGYNILNNKTLCDDKYLVYKVCFEADRLGFVELAKILAIHNPTDEAVEVEVQNIRGTSFSILQGVELLAMLAGKEHIIGGIAESSKKLISAPENAQLVRDTAREILTNRKSPTLKLAGLILGECFGGYKDKANHLLSSGLGGGGGCMDALSCLLGGGDNKEIIAPRGNNSDDEGDSSSSSSLSDTNEEDDKFLIPDFLQPSKSSEKSVEKVKEKPVEKSVEREKPVERERSVEREKQAERKKSAPVPIPKRVEEDEDDEDTELPEYKEPVARSHRETSHPRKQVLEYDSPGSDSEEEPQKVTQRVTRRTELKSNKPSTSRNNDEREFKTSVKKTITDNLNSSRSVRKDRYVEESTSSRKRK